MALDLSLLATAVAVGAVGLTGVMLHEVLGVALIALIAMHLSLRVKTIAAAAKAAVAASPWRSRVKIFIHAGLFLAAVLAIGSGLMISERVVPAFGLASRADPIWRPIHVLSQLGMLSFVGLHLAINRHWSDRLVEWLGRAWRSRAAIIALLAATILLALYPPGRGLLSLTKEICIIGAAMLLGRTVLGASP